MGGSVTWGSCAALVLFGTLALAPGASAWVLVYNCSVGGVASGTDWVCDQEPGVVDLRCIDVEVDTLDQSFTIHGSLGCAASATYRLSLKIDSSEARGHIASPQVADQGDQQSSSRVAPRGGMRSNAAVPV